MSKPTTSQATAARLAGHAGIVIADARHERRWTLRELAERSGLAVSSLHAVEHGRPAGLETYAAIARAFGLEPRLDLIDPRKRAAPSRAEDPVHAAMGEVLADRLASHGFTVAIDEPYQHFQFAGRADVLAWDLVRRALLHVENRTRFPNLQDAIGSYNAKRQFLPGVIAERLGLRGGFATVTHVMAGLWSSEVIHTARIRAATFAAVCPHDGQPFEMWWQGTPPEPGRPTSSFILLDPIRAEGGHRMWFGGFGPAVRPRYRGYADAAESLRRGGGV
jgi:lambda repressor-like predicted transcriptional regulator